MAALFRAGLPAEEWRRRPADGVLWVLLHGALSGGKTLAVAVCYLPPPRPPAGEAEELAAEWFEQLAADWVAALSAGWVPMIAGDLNARVACGEDWSPELPCLPRSSEDLVADPRGALLLRFCREQGPRIVNGRVAGDTAAPTSAPVSPAQRSSTTCSYLVTGSTWPARWACPRSPWSPTTAAWWWPSPPLQRIGL